MKSDSLFNSQLRAPGYPLTDHCEFDILQTGPWLAGCRVQFDRLRQRESITLRGGNRGRMAAHRAQQPMPVIGFFWRWN